MREGQQRKNGRLRQPHGVPRHCRTLQRQTTVKSHQGNAVQARGHMHAPQTHKAGQGNHSSSGRGGITFACVPPPFLSATTRPYVEHASAPTWLLWGTPPVAHDTAQSAHSAGQGARQSTLPQQAKVVACNKQSTKRGMPLGPQSRVRAVGVGTMHGAASHL